MNAGFSNLITLKTHLLAAALRAATDYDTPILNLGLGVATALENFCNRDFARVVGEQEVFPADRCEFLLSRYPVESISFSEIKSTEVLGWVTQTDPNFIRAIQNKSGVVNCGPGDAGLYYEQVRFTYTGGFWWDTSEDNSGTLPTGANLIPNDLKYAWLLQCELTWKMRDKLGTQIADSDGKNRGPTYQLSDLDLAPQVRQMIEPFKRYALV